MADNENTILTEENESTRIINLSEASEMDAGMYFVTDSSNGTRKVPITKLIDADLEKEYAAAPAKEVGDLKEELEHISGISDDVKVALLQIASKVAYIDEDGQDYYDALYDALYPPADLVSISAVYTQSGTVYDTDTLDSLKDDLVVTALYDDQTTGTVTTYTLSGTLEVGASTITVTYGGKTTTFTVTVTEYSPYTYFDYIAMTYNAGDTIPSNSGILTDIPMSSDYIMELSLYYNSDGSQPQNIMGIRAGQSGAKQFGLFLTPSNGKLGYWYDGTDTSQTITITKAQLNELIIQPVGVSQTYPTYATVNINGTDYSLGSTATGKTWNSWLGLFKYGISATSTSTSTTDKYLGQQLGDIIIKDLSNNILHHLRPAYDGERYGVADTVTGDFYYNETYADKYVCGNWA